MSNVEGKTLRNYAVRHFGQVSFIQAQVAQLFAYLVPRAGIEPARYRVPRDFKFFSEGFSLFFIKRHLNHIFLDIPATFH